GRGLFYEGQTPKSEKIRIASVTDGLSNTLMLGEILAGQSAAESFSCVSGAGGIKGKGNPRCSAYLGTGATPGKIPHNYYCKTYDLDNCQCSCPDPAVNPWNWSQCSGYKSQHVGGVQFAFGDGSVHFISQNIDQVTLIKLGERNDGGVVQLP